MASPRSLVWHDEENRSDEGICPLRNNFIKKKKRKTRNKKKKKEIRTAVSIVASYTPRGFFNNQPSPRGQEKTLGRTAIKIRSGIYRRNN